jgi:hypothetical protein
MCGILGQINFSGQPVDPNGLMAMSSTMTSRGPDGSGLYVQGRLGFGHRRLKVIDLTQSSQQPMVDAKLGLGIVFIDIRISNAIPWRYPKRGCLHAASRFSQIPGSASETCCHIPSTGPVPS